MEKGLDFFLRKNSSLPMSCFGRTSKWLSMPFLGTSVPKAQFLFPLKLGASSFPSRVGLRLGFFSAPPGAGQGGPKDRGWLNMSFPPLPPRALWLPALSDSRTQPVGFRLPLLHTPGQTHRVLFSVPPCLPSKALEWQPWEGWLCGITRV